MERVMSMTERAEEVANNAWLKLAGRFGSIIMGVVGALMIPLMMGVWSWAVETGRDLDALRGRVVALETNGTRSREDRVKFQDATTLQLQEILKQVSAGNERAAGVAAQVNELTKRMDRGG